MGEGEEKIVDDVGTAKLLDLLLGKQTQLYTLWGFYTAVELTAGGFGSRESLTKAMAWGVVLGVWAFNLGHLGFVLSCVRQISRLRAAVNYRLLGKDELFKKVAKEALADMNEADFFWRFYADKANRSKYLMSTVTHLFIDACASFVLLSRAM